jgi:AbrB family looped-hinge helix DNA binding protein
MLTTITTKGQVTIPKALRDQFSLGPKDKVDFIADGDRIILRPIRTLRDLRGCIPGRGEPEEERNTAKNAVAKRVLGEME